MAAHGGVRRNVRLTPKQQLHERLMKELLKRIRGWGLVLRGGSAVAFAYGGNRHSTDLDLDGKAAANQGGRAGCRCQDRLHQAQGWEVPAAVPGTLPLPT